MQGLLRLKSLKAPTALKANGNSKGTNGNAGREVESPTKATPPGQAAGQANDKREKVVSKELKRSSPENLTLHGLDQPRLQQHHEALELREQLLDRRDREFERRDRELDRRERELERRERELDRRDREFEAERSRASTFASSIPFSAGTHGQVLTPTTGTPPALDDLNVRLEKEVSELKTHIQKLFAEERKKTETREGQLETRIQKSLKKALDQERQTYYGFMKMSDHEVNEMVEDTVGYMMEKDEDIADRVRFQSLIYLAQEKLAAEAGINPEIGAGSLPAAWKILLGPSLVTEERLNKAQELFKDRDVSPPTSSLLKNKTAMEYAVDYNLHLRKEGSDAGEKSFVPGRISRDSYLETAKRQAKRSGLNYEALVTLIDYISPSSS